MGNPSEFCLVVEKKAANKSFQAILAAVGEQGKVKKQPHQPYELVVGSMTYDLKQEKETTRFGNSQIRLHSVATLSEEEQFARFFDFCFDVCRKIDPLYGLADNGITVYDYGPAWSAVEHYRNPYFFCLEPPKAEYGYDPADDFIHNETMLSKISEIRRVLSLDELLTLLRTHCKKVAVGDKGGVTVWKDEKGDTESAVGLRYFLAQEVRRRGIHLEEGSAEKYARELGVK
ncbi:hypothetical protein HYY73_04135 [Candidatus Woesearchaeota archaeon]|nr:hypothetical protein [Candidatus Woesearchaeota archaeon]